jgi:hypothetical protein
MGTLQVYISNEKLAQIREYVLEFIPPRAIARKLGIDAVEFILALKDEENRAYSIFYDAVMELEQTVGLSWVSNPKNLSVEQLEAIENKLRRYLATVKIQVYA